jgi:hypothetical protein
VSLSPCDASGRRGEATPRRSIEVGGAVFAIGRTAESIEFRGGIGARHQGRARGRTSITAWMAIVAPIPLARSARAFAPPQSKTPELLLARAVYLILA